MANKYKRKTDGLDPERGNKLIISREDLLPLYGPRMKQEDASGIIYTLGKWFCDPQGTPEPKLDNPFADAFLSVLIGRQKENVRHYFAQCEARSPQSGRDEEGQGEISRDKEDNKTKETKPNEPKGSFGLVSSVGGLASPPPPVADSVGKVKVGSKLYPPQQIIAQFAPRDYFGKTGAHNSADDDREYYAKYYQPLDSQIIVEECIGIDYGIEENLELPEVKTTLAAIRRAKSEIGNDLTARAVWKFEIDKENEQLPSNLLEDTDEAYEARAKLLIARLGYVREAKALLDARRDKVT